MDADKYVLDLLNGFDYGQVLVVPKKRDGFYTHWRDYKLFFIEVPQARYFKLSRFDRLALRHETGHVIFHYLTVVDPLKIATILKAAKKKYFIWPLRFWRVQRFWYWGKCARFFKRLFGFSRKLDYKPGDQYMMTAFYRWENELFCDWFALYGYKTLRDFERLIK